MNANLWVRFLSRAQIRGAIGASGDAKKNRRPVKPQASFRLFRSGLIGSIVLSLATGGHLAGGGQLPTPAILAALCAVTMVPVAALTRSRLSFPVLSGLISAGQALLHWVFDALSAGTPAALPPTLLSGHAGHTAATLSHETFVLVAPVHEAAPDGPMTAAHALATLGTALLLARGERALDVLANWLRPLLRAPEPNMIVPTRILRLSPAAAVLPPKQHGVRLPSRRGPPLFAPA